MPPAVTYSICPTGGAIVLYTTLGDPTLNIFSSFLKIQRLTGSLSATPVTIYNSVYVPTFIDAGEALPTFLDFTTPYFYIVTDATGSTAVGNIVPAPQLQVFSNYMDGLLFRLFSAGLTGQAVPMGFKPIRVLESLPLTPGSDGSIMPFVVMNLDLEQQENLQIGEDVLASETNLNILPVHVMRRYSISILSHNAKERDFYKDACIGSLYAMMVSLQDMGQDYSHTIQATNNQVSEGIDMPGFYLAVIMFEFTGQFNMSITTTIPPISVISPDLSFSTGNTTSNVIDPAI